jgi:hypothetical protein
MKNINKIDAGNMNFYDDDQLAEFLIEIANTRHPKLKLFPLELEQVKSHSDEIESRDKFGMLGKLHNITVSGILSNGSKRQSVAISFLVSSIDIEEDTNFRI